MGKKKQATLTSRYFPNSYESPFIITSVETDKYNCVAWSMLDIERWWDWEEGAFWIEGIPKNGELATFIHLFNKLDFEGCLDGECEPKYQKIALFSDDDIHCTHVARQLENGNWTSKLGVSYDVEHTLKAMEGGMYGNVALFMRKLQLSKSST